MELSTMAIVGWLAQPAAAALVNVAQQYLVQRLGLGSSPSAASGVKPILDDYLQKLTARSDEDRIAKLHGAFSTLLDAPKSVARHGLLIEALDSFHEVAQIPEQGMTGGHPNAELRCMAFVGMAASHTLLGDRSELIVEKMVQAVYADADTTKQWLGEDLVREILSRFPPPGVICPKCGFQNPAGSRFCNRDGCPLPQSQPSSPSTSRSSSRPQSHSSQRSSTTYFLPPTHSLLPILLYGIVTGIIVSLLIPIIYRLNGSNSPLGPPFTLLAPSVVVLLSGFIIGRKIGTLRAGFFSGVIAGVIFGIVDVVFGDPPILILISLGLGGPCSLFGAWLAIHMRP